MNYSHTMSVESQLILATATPAFNHSLILTRGILYEISKKLKEQVFSKYFLSTLGLF